jgi:hypothetical protein
MRKFESVELRQGIGLKNEGSDFGAVVGVSTPPKVGVTTGKWTWGCSWF